jgi:hypothetical protein
MRSRNGSIHTNVDPPCFQNTLKSILFPHTAFKNQNACNSCVGRDVCIEAPIILDKILSKWFRRDVVYHGWPIAPSYMSPNARGERDLRGLSQWAKLYTGAQKNFGDLTPYLAYDFKCRICSWGFVRIGCLGCIYKCFISLNCLWLYCPYVALKSFINYCSV